MITPDKGIRNLSIAERKLVLKLAKEFRELPAKERERLLCTPSEFEYLKDCVKTVWPPWHRWGWMRFPQQRNQWIFIPKALREKVLRDGRVQGRLMNRSTILYGLLVRPPKEYIRRFRSFVYWWPVFLLLIKMFPPVTPRWSQEEVERALQSTKQEGP